MYVLIYLLRGGYIYQTDHKKLKYQAKKQFLIKEKLTRTVEDLAKGLPEQIKYAFSYIKSLRLQEKPDYGFLK